MKTINRYIIVLVALLPLCISSCDTDNEGAIYNVGDKAAVTFLTNAYAYTLSNAEPNATLTVYRGNVAQAADIKLTSTAVQCEVSETVHFDAGQNTATLNIGIGKLKGGESETFTIAFPETGATPGCTSKASIKVQAAFSWSVFGTGQFTDQWTFEDAKAHGYDVSIEKADGYERYRVVKPYDKGFELLGETGSNPASYLIFTIDGEKVSFEEFAIGYNYQGKTPIKGRMGGLPNTYANGIVTLSPNYYVPGVGSFGDAEGAITIVMPKK
ncbi:hypothetical protein [Bacteroides heparinolyticus]|uniref:DUF4843 domain-containing protein n=2 Tax=Prevotella heparinolytica TaxID=28113 RepID=A0A449I0Q4_9BACE|nr:hypothetical protein [Bacteroides heparinolyticus]MCI6213528.1 hypothetical protein [Bacteroides heparinolyticus]VFB13053.1 Uncharacterised protein [Bacteroides heparinolyticus]